jgi:hypothetical protein
MEKQLLNACERFRDALESADLSHKAECYALRKGRTLYVVSSKARELRRLDTIYSEARG